ncbi:MHS family MFS transporter [Pseudonocardia yuanmonensis]|uniref:MHS family MFS transporter n=1 Tax=Pseudonocardia yuanmonensis TaxID=1095914 RepID=A0ABP8XAA6_9PSEU
MGNQLRRPPAASMRRIAIASCAGTTIEFYDFFIYGTAAALVFPKVFFPALGSAAATVASFATVAVAFIARPVGAVLFGHYGDRLGRKRTLISTLLLMGTATVLIGLLPGSASIGVAAPIILVALRFAQGFAVGGEWAGATLLTAEYAPKEKRGFYGVFPQVGPAIAFALSSGTFLATSLIMGDSNEAFLDYGWRIPFLLSALLVAVGFYIRMNIDETPAFKAARTAAQAADAAPKRLPFVEAVRSQPREVLLSAGSLTLLFAFFYIGTAYVTSYATAPGGAGLSRPVVLGVGVGAAVVIGFVIVFAGVLSDRFGRRPVMILSAVLGIGWSLALFPLIDTGSAFAFAIAQTVTLAIFAVAYGPAGSFLPELFAPRHRYTGAGLGYNIGALVGGAIPPLLAPGIVASFGSFGIGLLLSFLGVIALFSTLALKETRGQAMAHEQPAATPQADPIG